MLEPEILIIRNMKLLNPTIRLAIKKLESGGLISDWLLKEHTK